MSKIRRNMFYHTDHSKQNYWCDRCYNSLKEETSIQLDDGKETKKSHLLRLKNDATPEEQWVQCDDCNNWNHQICALFSASRRNSSKTFSCPRCVVAKSKGDQFAKKDSPVSSFKDASALPECKLSLAIEKGLSQALLEEYERLANERGCDVVEVEKVNGLCVRVVMSLEKKHKVREGVSFVRCSICICLYCSNSHSLCCYADAPDVVQIFKQRLSF
jgi:E1A/CREB-binding protein